MKKKRIIIAGTVITMLLGCLPYHVPSVEAISKNAKAKKAYAKILSSEDMTVNTYSVDRDSKSVKFALIDINRDGVQEMLFTPDNGYHLSIYSYVNGKAKHVTDEFSGMQKYYPNKKLYYSGTTHGTTYNSFCRFNGKKMVELASYYNKGYITQYEKDATYYISSKKVSKKKYQNYVKKLKKGAIEKKPKFYRNTKTNRKKYLKQ